MRGETQRNVVGIGAQVAVMLLAVVLLVPLLTRGGERVRHATPPTVSPPGAPIAEEADVFRTRPEALAVAPSASATEDARPRTLASTRSLRAYPGAPPRIPHALTEDEWRDASCVNCHERGGFASRFGAYTPITPHPAYESCLQCHVPQETSSLFVETGWRTAAWPEVGRRAMEGSPPWIPHTLQLRGNCLACHGGPGAVVEIRTTHPERANCRQCHVPSEGQDGAEAFRRPLDRTVPSPGGA